MTMRNSLLTVLGSVMLLGAALPAHSESVLRIGLGADPDMLDPHHLLWPFRLCVSVRPAGGRG